MICGGMMSGNCAMGRDCIDTSPASTVTMAMTIATIGLLMKKRDMWRWPSVGRGLGTGGSRRPRFGVHDRSVPYLRAFDDDVLVGLDSLRHDPAAAETLAHRHGSCRHAVVGTDDSQLISALHFRDGSLRDEYRALDGPCFRAHPSVLPRPERAAGIRKRRV